MSLRTETNDGILVITLDDGGRNALVPDTFAALNDALDAGADADAIVLAGREGALTVGLDVKWMQGAGRDDVGHMLRQLGRTCMRLWTDPRPTVCAATGHALAAGTMLAMACDHTRSKPHATGGFPYSRRPLRWRHELSSRISRCTCWATSVALMPPMPNGVSARQPNRPAHPPCSRQTSPKENYPHTAARYLMDVRAARKNMSRDLSCSLRCPHSAG